MSRIKNGLIEKSEWAMKEEKKTKKKERKVKKYKSKIENKIK